MMAQARTPQARSAGPGKEFEFTADHFARVRELIYGQAGIALATTKQEMVYSRLSRRLRSRGIGNFDEYLCGLESGRDAEEWEAFINALTTNLTAFFREAHHFPILAGHIRNRRDEIVIWCSASSTGEEPYSLAMTLVEALRSWTPRARIIASDIDTNVLAQAEAGVYSMDRLEKMPQERIKRFFLKGKGERDGQVRVRPELRQLISFMPLNLLSDNWPLKEQFDAIFCRNVMIYFDKPTQARILARFAPLMKPDGLLFAGHSENFSYITDAFRLREKTVYELTNKKRDQTHAKRT